MLRESLTTWIACDRCKDAFQSFPGGMTMAQINDKLQRQGWETPAEFEHICRSCAFSADASGNRTIPSYGSDRPEGDEA